jgi:hypothetical protein
MNEQFCNYNYYIFLYLKDRIKQLKQKVTAAIDNGNR